MKIRVLILLTIFVSFPAYAGEQRDGRASSESEGRSVQNVEAVDGRARVLVEQQNAASGLSTTEPAASSGNHTVVVNQDGTLTDMYWEGNRITRIVNRGTDRSKPTEYIFDDDGSYRPIQDNPQRK